MEPSMNESLKQVLVHLDATGGGVHRLRAAREIAQAHGAAVSALYAAAPTYLGLPATGAMAPSAVDALVEIDNERRARARGAFDAACATPGPIASWDETDEVPIIGAFVQQALYADLLVLGQHDASDPDAAAVPRDFAESVVIASGKPGLIIPYTGWNRSIGETAVIAWKPTRESARAVAAAIPLMRRSRSVHIVAWHAAEADAGAGQRLDLDSYLRLHGIQPTWHREGGEPDAIGELLLSRCFDLDADLLVMGCFGHSRARELLLGGASRTVMRSLTLPVLMAH
jgi:nucleotide-binding universal stress UspA family protein